MVNCRKASNVIHGLDVGGRWIAKPSLTKKEVFSFFRNKFLEDCEVRPFLECDNLKKISAAEAEGLEARFSKEEVKAAVFECGDDRAPGPDGFNFRFFKHFWCLFEEDFVKVMEGFFESGRISMGCGSSFIALIPKSRNPTGLNDYRPISLVGVVNKVISKILASRLKRVLGAVISDSQSAFLSGKYILDGPLIVNEVFSWLKRRNKKAFFLKIDFEKAYDNINWKFVVDILDQMGFRPRWCNWITGILSSARASVLVNGSPTFEFKCGKGMRQGDPLSPFLFVIVMEALSRMFDKACEIGILEGIRLPNDGPRVSHLFYADDAIIAGNWDENMALNSVRVLRCFYACSGLKINLGKSNLYGIGVSSLELEDMANLVGCKADSLPFKYLGLTVGANMNRVSNWRPVYDIFEKRLSLWKASVLSIGGRVTLIRSVLESLPTYYLSLYKAPLKVIKDLEGLIKKFLWGGSSEGRKMNWVAWERVASPIKCGGLGLSKLLEVNTALLSKWGWRYKCGRDNLWVKVVDAIHSGGSNWSFVPVCKSASGVWRNIVSVLNRPVFGNVPLRNFFKGRVGNGGDILFWLDPWLKDRPLKECFPNLFRLEVVKNCAVRDRVEGVGVWLWRHEPDFDVEVNEFAVLQAALQPVSLVDRSDGREWLGDSKGVFSVRSAKMLLSKGRDFSNRFVMSWCKWVPLKCNVFAWRSELNRIPTKDALRKRGIVTGDDLCPLCRSEEETVEHLFTSCLVASILWQKISMWCRIQNIFAFSFRDLLEVQNAGGMGAVGKSALEGIMVISCWSLWKARNNAVFSDSTAKVDDIFSEVKSQGYLWFKHRSKFQSVQWSDWCKFVFL
ncbi:hypothetical protein L1987_05677 [Smallanthus sonchifolius]|uniref:Uncharacterized protein n=1 Tax=Smallanthus sonchifolius TaxID=185202 RepID=A0ACB9JW41_9ASTR|nr:hypothetical protein L1987_05677 [Smallanthus sonchifolius]